MPLYYFHVDDGSPYGVPAGIELPDHDAARRQAATYFSALIRDGSGALGAGEAWQLRVTDDEGVTCFSLQFAAVGAVPGGSGTYRTLTDEMLSRR